jgi:hypothetical protein
MSVELCASLVVDNALAEIVVVFSKFIMIVGGIWVVIRNLQ